MLMPHLFSPYFIPLQNHLTTLGSATMGFPHCQNDCFKSRVRKNPHWLPAFVHQLWLQTFYKKLAVCYAGCSCQDAPISFSLPQGLCPFFLEMFLHPPYSYLLLLWSTALMEHPTCFCPNPQFALVSLVTVALRKRPSDSVPVCPMKGI